MSWVFDHSESVFADRLILLSIANHCDRYGTDAWPLQATIAAEAKVSTREVVRAVQSLVEIGELKVEKGKGKIGRNRYTLLGMEADSKQQIESDRLSLRDRDSQVTSTTVLSDKYDNPKCHSVTCYKEEPSITIQKQLSKTIEVPDWIPRELFDNWIEMRKVTKHPVTGPAILAGISVLKKLRLEGQDVATVLENTILNGWRGFFPVKIQTANAGFVPRDFKQEAIDRSQNEYMTKNHGPNWREKVAARAQS